MDRGGNWYKPSDLGQRETPGVSAQGRADWVRQSYQEGSPSRQANEGIPPSTSEDEYTRTLKKHIRETDNMAREQESEISALSERYKEIFDNPKNKNKLQNLQDKYQFKLQELQERHALQRDDMEIRHSGERERAQRSY